MVKKAELAAVAHNIAHHAGSGLSYISPHLANALRARGATTTKVSLLCENPYPDNAASIHALRKALASLHLKSISILETHGFSQEAVAGIDLYATPAAWDVDGYLLHTRVVVTSNSGREYDSGWMPNVR